MATPKKYKFITITQNGEFDYKPMYTITNNKSSDTLGVLFYYKDWKQYVFTQHNESIVFNSACLENIVDFIKTEILCQKKKYIP